MIGTSRYLSQKKKKLSLELLNTEIAGRHNKLKMPRHIAQVESRSHKRGANLGKIDHMPRICKIDPYRAKLASLAVDILKYQLSDRQTKIKHLENLRYNLERRIQVAQAQSNCELVNILHQEFQQLETSNTTVK